MGGGNGITGASVGVPFPIPQSGLEVLWNFLTRYRGVAATRNIDQAAVEAYVAAVVTAKDAVKLSGLLKGSRRVTWVALGIEARVDPATAVDDMLEHLKRWDVPLRRHYR